MKFNILWCMVVQLKGEHFLTMQRHPLGQYLNVATKLGHPDLDHRQIGQSSLSQCKPYGRGKWQCFKKYLVLGWVYYMDIRSLQGPCKMWNMDDLDLISRSQRPLIQFLRQLLGVACFVTIGGRSLQLHPRTPLGTLNLWCKIQINVTKFEVTVTLNFFRWNW